MADKKQKKSSYIGVGLALGVVFGLMLDNLGVGIALGVVFGTAFGGFEEEKDSKKENKEK